MSLNIPMNCIGLRYAPWLRDDEPEVEYCDHCQITEVDEYGKWCDRCLVRNAEECGDWDDEALEAKRRLTATN